MIAADSVDRTPPAEIYFHIPDIDFDVPGATMGAEDAGGPAGVDLDVGVLHGNGRVAVDALESNDSGPSSFHIDQNVADDDFLVAAERVVRVVFSARAAPGRPSATPATMTATPNASPAPARRARPGAAFPEARGP